MQPMDYESGSDQNNEQNNNHFQSQNESYNSYLPVPTPVINRNIRIVHGGRYTSRPRIHGCAQIRGIRQCGGARLPRQPCPLLLTYAQLGWKIDTGKYNLVLPPFTAIPGVEPILDTTPSETL